MHDITPELMALIQEEPGYADEIEKAAAENRVVPLVVKGTQDKRDRVYAMICYANCLGVTVVFVPDQEIPS